MRPTLINISVKGNSIGILFILMILICLGACSPKHSSYSEFKEINHEGWAKTAAYEFIPQYGDSLGEYDVKLALCYAHDYPYRNISVVVDFMKNDSLVERTEVDYELTDFNGNRKIAGFGVAYQSEHDVKSGVKVGDFDKIIVWQGLSCDTLKSVTQVGLILKKRE